MNPPGDLDCQVILPGDPPPKLNIIWAVLDNHTRSALLRHLLGGTNAEWIADTLRSEGYSISASTIRVYRRSLERGGVQVGQGD